VLLCQLLFAISKSFEPRDPGRRVDTTRPEDSNAGLGKIVAGMVQQPPQPHFKRLHILYIASDVLTTLHYRNLDSRAPNPESVAVIERYLPLLAGLATFRGHSKYAPNYPDTLSLLLIWLNNSILSESQLAEIHAKTLQASTSTLTWPTFLAGVNSEETQITQTLAREAETANLGLPKTHGVPHDPTAPWHELPAANGLFMKRTRGYPLKAAALPQGGYEVKEAGQYTNKSIP